MPEQEHEGRQVQGLGEIVLIHDLKKQELSISAIARKVGCDRKTVRKYLERGLEAPVYGPRQPRDRLLAPYDDYLRDRALAFPDLSGSRLLREIRNLGYKGGYTAVTGLPRATSDRRRGRGSSAASRRHQAGRRRSTSRSSRCRSPTRPASPARSGCSR